MEETEKKAPPPQICLCRKRPVLSAFVVLALLIGTAGLALVYAPLPPFSTLFEGKTGALDALERRVDALEAEIRGFRETRPDPLANAPLLTAPEESPLGAEIKSLRERIENEGKEDARLMQRAVAAALTFSALKEDAQNGRGFEERLTTLRALMADNPKVLDLASTMEPFAKEPPLTVAQLTEAFRIEEKNARHLPESTEKTSWLDRIKNILRPLISVTRVNSERFAPVREALERSKARAALDAVKALSEDVAQGLGPWKEKLEARVALDDAVHEMAAVLMTPPAEKSAP